MATTQDIFCAWKGTPNKIYRFFGSYAKEKKSARFCDKLIESFIIRNDKRRETMLEIKNFSKIYKK